MMFGHAVHIRALPMLTCPKMFLPLCVFSHRTRSLSNFPTACFLVATSRTISSKVIEPASCCGRSCSLSLTFLHIELWRKFLGVWSSKDVSLVDSMLHRFPLLGGMRQGTTLETWLVERWVPIRERHASWRRVTARLSL